MRPLIDGEVLTKTCRICNIEKPLSEFNPNKECKLGRVGTCKLCSNERVRKWLKTRREERRFTINTRNKDRKQLVVNSFGNKCSVCGESFPLCVYDFHHIKGKDVNPSKALTWSEERMWKELQKCIMVCANCHRVLHFGGGE